MATTTAKKTAARKTARPPAGKTPRQTVRKPAVQAAARKTAIQQAAPARTVAAPVKKAAAPGAKTTKAQAVQPPKSTDKTVKHKKPKLVRDSFTVPKDEYAVIHQLKTRAQTLGRAVKKSELLRAGIKLLAAQADAAFHAALQAVPVIKTGRPKSAK